MRMQEEVSGGLGPSLSPHGSPGFAAAAVGRILQSQRQGGVIFNPNIERTDAQGCQASKKLPL